MTGMLLAPPLQHTALDRIELVPLGDDRALAVIVTETGWVTARAISSAARVPGDDLREIGRALTRRYRGKTFRQIVDDVAAPADPLDPLWTRERMRCSSRSPRCCVIARSTSAAPPTCSTTRTCPTSAPCARCCRPSRKRPSSSTCSRGWRPSAGVQVMIGSENPVKEMRECSLIASTYTYRDQALGVLGVVGPRRMAYSDVIALVDETARLVSDSLSRVKHQLYLPS